MAWLNQKPDTQGTETENVPVRESDPTSPRSERGFTAPLPENMRLLNLNDPDLCQSQNGEEKNGHEHEDNSSSNSSMPPLSSNPIDPSSEALCDSPRESPQGASCLTTDHAPIQADEPNDERVAIRHKHMREKTESQVNSSEEVSLQDYSYLDSSWGSVSSVVHCQKCEIYRGGFPSSESHDFWKFLDNIPNCHTKHFHILIKGLKDKFPADKDLLSDKKMINVLKAILHVDESDDAAEVSLKDYQRLVRFFGPVCEKDNRCILLSQLKIIIEKSLQYKDSRRKEKISWFAGDINRQKSEDLLRNQKDGTFLVRMSQSQAEDGTFAVSIIHDNEYHHFSIMGHPNEAVKTCTANEYSACLEWKGNCYSNLPEVVEKIRTDSLNVDDESDEVMYVRSVCPNLPLNAQICGYKKARR